MSRVVLVTGATGFIGNAVAQEFSRAGYQVYGLSRSSIHSKALLQSEIVPIVAEVYKPETYEKFIEQAQIIIHCATGVSENPFENDKSNQS